MPLEEGSFLSVLDNGELACELGLDAKYWLIRSRGKGSGGGREGSSGTPVLVELGVRSVFEMGRTSQRSRVGGGSQPSNPARQIIHCGHISSGDIRQPGSDVPASALPLSHTEKP